MTDHSWQSVFIDGVIYKTNGINLVTCNGIPVAINTPLFKRVIAQFKRNSDEAYAAFLRDSLAEVKATGRGA